MIIRCEGDAEDNLHLDMEVYIFLLMGGFECNVYGTDEELLETLLELDMLLPKTRESDPLVYNFDNGYSWLLFFTAGLGRCKRSI